MTARLVKLESQVLWAVLVSVCFLIGGFDFCVFGKSRLKAQVSFKLKCAYKK